jgi:hypothetical protein
LSIQTSFRKAPGASIIGRRVMFASCGLNELVAIELHQRVPVGRERERVAVKKAAIDLIMA